MSDQSDQPEPTAFEPAVVRTARRVSEASVAWTLVASTIAVGLGAASGSSALVAFGLVGLVDLVGSVALVHHFRHALRNDELSDRFERRAHRIVTFGLLAIGLGTVTISAVRLANGHHAKSSTAGMVLAAISLVALACFATGKIRIARDVPSEALRADGVLSGVGAAQAAVVLLGTVLAAAFSWYWADDTAAVVVGAVAVGIAVATLLGDAARPG